VNRSNCKKKREKKKMGCLLNCIVSFFHLSWFVFQMTDIFQKKKKKQGKKGSQKKEQKESKCDFLLKRNKNSTR
jgi:hypothetical protein